MKQRFPFALSAGLKLFFVLWCVIFLAEQGQARQVSAPPVLLRRIDVTLGDQRAMILLPRGYNAHQKTMLCLYHHGAGEDEAALLRDPLKAGTVNALLGAGYILAGSNAHGENWGNQSAIDDYVTLYKYLASHYKVSKLVFWSQSMGGLSGLNTIARHVLPVKAWAGTYPVCNLQSLYSLGTYANAIRAAYGIAPDSSDYDAKTRGYNPVLRQASDYNSVPLRFWASYGDTVVPQPQNTDVMRTLTASFPNERSLFECTGNHGDPSHFQPSDMLAFYQRALSDTPTRHKKNKARD